jgi:hypothetical protein
LLHSAAGVAACAASAARVAGAENRAAGIVTPDSVYSSIYTGRPGDGDETPPRVCSAASLTTSEASGAQEGDTATHASGGGSARG